MKTPDGVERAAEWVKCVDDDDAVNQVLEEVFKVGATEEWSQGHYKALKEHAEEQTKQKEKHKTPRLMSITRLV